MAGEAWLILPTYNEAGNIERFIRAVYPVLQESSNSGFRILVVDDNSPDGTGEIADHLSEELPEVSVLHRPGKGGLGPAYIAGFKQALSEGAEYVMEMDSDFSHTPVDVARLLDPAQSGYDLVLGSRYTTGGGVKDWGLTRRILSRGGSRYAQLTLGLHVKDLTGGFKCFNRKVLESIDLDSVRSYGYAFQVELTYRAVKRGFRILEVPIVFRDRLVGESKMSPKIALEAIWLVPALRFGRAAKKK